MPVAVTIDLRHVARGLGIPLRQVEAVVELLDEGNTVPFITRYRKDHTGGLDEEQIRSIQARLNKMRLLAERKQTILRSIESQGKLTEALAQQIQAAASAKRLEDLYLPFKPRKQTLAMLARSRGLDLLATEILTAAASCADLDARAADFVNPDRQVPTAADALLGAGHILAEQLSERAELRQSLRDILQRTGRLVSAPFAAELSAPVAGRSAESEPAAGDGTGAEPKPAVAEPAPASESPAPGASASESPVADVSASESPVSDALPSPAPVEAQLAAQAAPPAGAEPPPAAPPLAQASKPAAKPGAGGQRLSKKELEKKKAEQRKLHAFSDYFGYSDQIKRVLPHRVLAINRGERARVLRVRIECDTQAMHQALEEAWVPPGHPHADFLRGCARDALARLILPALERELRRELTERAEAHAVSVFARNLRNLLLQPPVRDRRVLAVDPGFKSGCKLAALDQFGNVLAHGVIFLVGKPERRLEAKQTVLDMVASFQLSVIVIGNGTGCRETEDFIADLLANELKDQGVCYVIVNEAGASVYSTSRIGREELPQYDASVRGAVSIGRRLQDPLSELVKIDPASIGVGLYQHDVKAKHLRSSLDEVVESCVNYVGVDVNTASPALLRYVSGLNQLTARRLYEYRQQHGPFRTREQLREVPGFGEATFVQAAGFLKIVGGDNPLDATWIHPESYQIATHVMARLPGAQAGQTAGPRDASGARPDPKALAAELGVGVLLLEDILCQLARPGRDPREDLPPPIFRRGVLKLEDLAPGMELTGTVLNVVDFGAFVDIGMHDSGLVHVSHLADRFVRDPHDVVAVGDIVKVWVIGVDKQRRRVSLSMIRPGAERPPRRRPEAAPAAPSASEAAPPTPPERPARAQRGPRPRQGADRPKPQGRPPARSKAPPPRAKFQPKSRPKPIVPITDEMKSGKEPMRTFGDLMQFFQMKKQPPPAKPAADAPEAAEDEPKPPPAP